MPSSSVTTAFSMPSISAFRDRLSFRCSESASSMHAPNSFPSDQLNDGFDVSGLWYLH
ncbi:hypothetical protein SCLCIDRAFT_1221398 [Scleroderma citrinum Foug A]|uniref:Uncharacterized protein n=1 Tax=Scleroderma citrinum Foug A TaxID=1036808 RepID=A0A0C2YZY1_9AGAM|nr:hypothetical protein SCLCIDRAFT_1221398 [Scleroderma citrinum Foug A]